MVDRTGLRPTTDGSAGSEQAALEDMIKNYHKQQQSVPHPAPEPPQPEPPKSSKSSSGKKSSTSSTPSYIKQYNPDHNEFEPAYTIEKAEGTSGEENINDVASSKADVQDFIEDVVLNYTVDTMSEAFTESWSRSIIRHSVLEASRAADDILRFSPVIGIGLDAGLRIIDGEEMHHAINKSVLVTMSVSATTCAIVAIGGTMTPLIALLSLMISVLIDTAVSSLYDEIFK